MPEMKSAKRVQRFYLPSTKDLPADSPDCAWVDFEVGPMNTSDIIGIDMKGDEIIAGVQMITNRIKDWNFTDSNGDKLDITFDTVKQLDLGDFAFLQEQITLPSGLAVAEKKI
jgi:hypothetical protein